jgi:hypothetical protein
VKPQPPDPAGAAWRRKAMARLRRALTPEEYARVRRLTRDGRSLPVGPKGEEAMEHLLLRAQDEEVELLIRCQAVLGELANAPPLPAQAASTARDRLRFRFDAGSRELAMFLASLERNGFRTLTVEERAGEVSVFVGLGGQSDLEVVREMDLVLSLREFVRRAQGGGVRGHRLAPGPDRL